MYGSYHSLLLYYFCLLVTIARPRYLDVYLDILSFFSVSSGVYETGVGVSIGWISTRSFGGSGFDLDLGNWNYRDWTWNWYWNWDWDTLLKVGCNRTGEMYEILGCLFKLDFGIN